MRLPSKFLLRVFIPCLLSIHGGCSKTESGLNGIQLGSAVGSLIGYAIDGYTGGFLAGAALGGIAGGAVGVATNKEGKEVQASEEHEKIEENSSSCRSENEPEQTDAEIAEGENREPESPGIENENKMR